MGLVSTWLSGIGLGYALPSFAAAGIDNPAALAELDVIHFTALGIHDPEDRRKLFFLVQRIKMAVSDQEKQKETQCISSQIDAILLQTLPSNKKLNEYEASQSDISMLPSTIPTTTVAGATAEQALTSAATANRYLKENNHHHHQSYASSMLQQSRSLLLGVVDATTTNATTKPLQSVHKKQIAATTTAAASPFGQLLTPSPPSTSTTNGASYSPRYHHDHHQDHDDEGNNSIDNRFQSPPPRYSQPSSSHHASTNDDDNNNWELDDSGDSADDEASSVPTDDPDGAGVEGDVVVVEPPNIESLSISSSPTLTTTTTVGVATRRTSRRLQEQRQQQQQQHQVKKSITTGRGGGRGSTVSTTSTSNVGRSKMVIPTPSSGRGMSTTTTGTTSLSTTNINHRRETMDDSNFMKGSSRNNNNDDDQAVVTSTVAVTITSMEDCDTKNSNIIKPRRHSGVPIPKNKRTESTTTTAPTSTTGTSRALPSSNGNTTNNSKNNPSKSLRTGKQLSTIPSNAIAPMSPLVDWNTIKATTKATATANDDLQSVEENSRLNKRRARSMDRRSMSSLSSSTGNMKAESIRKNSLERRVSSGGIEGIQHYGESDSDQSSSSISQRKNGNHKKNNNRRHSHLPVIESSSHSSLQQQPQQSKEPQQQQQQQQPQQRKSLLTMMPNTAKTRSRSNTSRYQHGHLSESFGSDSVSSTNVLDDNGGGGGGSEKRGTIEMSFKAQITRLREENESDYELFGKPTTKNNNNDTHFDTYDDNDQERDNDDDDDDDLMRIRVVVRKRPMSKAEITMAGDIDVIHPMDYGRYGRILVYQPRTRVDLTKEIDTIPFAFDNVFDEKATNVQIYERSIRNLIPSLFGGKWVSIFAYGQTGSGKTFTMMGSSATGMNATTTNTGSVVTAGGIHAASSLGLYYMAALDLFQAIHMPGYDGFTISTSMFEIYGGKLFDLLNERQQVKCLEDSKGQVCFPGLTEHGVSTAEDLMELINQGGSNRSTGTTSRNADSSRSHAVLQLHLRTMETKTTTKKPANSSKVEHSRLTFIDLAGSERGADTATASRATRLEGAEINTSLLALKEVIRALATGDSMTHVPFRGSKLTQVLRESFVGKNGRSVMIACISPNIGNVEPTLNTLRYADRVKERNPETGQLSAAVVRSMATMKQSQQQQSRMMKPHPTLTSPMAVLTAAEFIDRQSSNHSRCSNSSRLLDDLLATPMSRQSSYTSIHDEEGDDDEQQQQQIPHLQKDLDSRQIAEYVIVEHKAAMSAMLAMVKDEMALVNQADSERAGGGLEDYISQLDAMQNKQLSIIASLREHLLLYHIAQSRSLGGCENGNDGDDDDRDLFPAEESYEDLRD